MFHSAIPCLLLVACAVVATQAAAEDMTLTIDADRPGIRISPMMYGVLLEEMSFAGEGGLYPQMLPNGSFEHADTPIDWEPWSRGGQAGSIAIETSRPLCPNSPKSLRITINRSGEEFGALNAGYWGISVKRGSSYRCTFHARSEGGRERRVGATLESPSGSVLGSSEVRLASEDWRKHDLRITASADCDAARLIISSGDPGAFLIDAVSLIPANSMRLGRSWVRRDLVRAIAGLRPAFIRFPGGCFVEGGRMEHASRWKGTIGPIGNRRSHWTYWSYPVGNGFGFHEYLLLCEKLKAEPMFVINCGMSHTDNVPIPDMGPLVQDALDAIEYCNGDVSTRWGAERAANGHPKPFNLKYIEIGNENSGPAYEERYPLFHDAIKARYPEIRVISTAPIKSRTPDILDEHYYQMPEWFARRASVVDRYDRKGPKVFVGEYGTMHMVGFGDLECALGDAILMMAMERNSDIVTMAAYAPLLGDLHLRRALTERLHPAASHPVFFDAHTWFGNSSYYVQKLMSENKGDRILPVTIPDVRRTSGSAGGIGLSTCFADVEFADIRITDRGETLYESRFPDDTGWSPKKGNWEVKGGVCRGTTLDLHCNTVLPMPDRRNYTLTLRARKLGGPDGFSILFRLADSDTFYRWNIGLWGNTNHAVDSATQKGNWLITEMVPGSIETDRWYDVRVQVTGDTARCYLDDRLVHKIDMSVPQFHAIAAQDDRSGDIIVKAVNLSERPVAATVSLAGVDTVATEAKLTVLTGSSRGAENSMDHPRAVYPKHRKITIPGPVFKHEFPPASFSIIRVRAATRGLAED